MKKKPSIMGANESRRLQPSFTITSNLLTIPTVFVGLVEGLANLRRDGKETDETEFMYELFEIYDKIHGTNLHEQFKAAIEKAIKEGKRQADWTQLNRSMPGINGKGYSATVTWVVNALLESADKLDKTDIARLFHLANKVCEWRASEIKRHGGADTGHQHAFSLWEQVKDLLKNFMNHKNWKSDL